MAHSMTGSLSHNNGIELAPLPIPSPPTLRAVSTKAIRTVLGSRPPATAGQDDASPEEVPVLLPGTSPGVGLSEPEQRLAISKAKAVSVITTLAGVSFLHTMGSGILIAALPAIAADVGIEEGLILWPAAVYSLAAGCLLLIFGAVADVVGAKLMWVTGSCLFVVFTVAIGFAQTGIQVIMFRTLSGVAISMCLPTAVSLITNTFPRGSWRNTAFAMNGMGQPLGYAVGLVLGGIFTDTVGWRWTYYMMGIINVLLSIASFFSLPSVWTSSEKRWTRRLVEDIDWTGAVIMSVALGLLLYVLAVTSSSYKRLDDPRNIAFLALAVALLGAFPVWMHMQMKRGKPALIPNKLWRNPTFTAICVSVFFSWASLTGLEYFITLYFQRVQVLSALRSSIQFLPHVVAGVATNIATAYLISRLRASYLVVGSAMIALVPPILMATIEVHASYWYAPFWALALSPINCDVLFTVSNVIISDAFPAHLQSLAGGVFNEVTQIGNAVGLAVTGAISASVTAHWLQKQGLDMSGVSKRAVPGEGGLSGPVHREALMEGYRVAFWTVLGSCAAVLVVSGWGLRRAGTVGKKNE